SVKTHALRLSRTKNLHFAIAPFPRFSALEELQARVEGVLCDAAKLSVNESHGVSRGDQSRY
ncbi:MAG: hypothetical protein WCH01_07720, partial [Methylococcaceae bacterium]